MPLAADRILPLCDLLLGAAFADQHLHDKEKEEVRALLGDLVGEVPPEVDAHIVAFNPRAFDLAGAVTPFLSDSEDDRKKLVVLASAIVEADGEHDFAEDDYLRALAAALGLPASALDGLTADITEEELQDTFAQVRKRPPPPPPGQRAPR
jgi:uncharacterized tellurite resistance protein B-like protein